MDVVHFSGVLFCGLSSRLVLGETVNRRKRQRQNHILKQVIMACVTCGAPNGKCIHDAGTMAMTKARAAALAISSTFTGVDYKSRASGERDE